MPETRQVWHVIEDEPEFDDPSLRQIVVGVYDNQEAAQQHADELSCQVDDEDDSDITWYVEGPYTVKSTFDPKDLNGNG